MNSHLSIFMKNHGVDLTNCGSAEKGLTQTEALNLLNILGNYNMKPLGLEVWHLCENGRYQIDSLAGWASDETLDSAVLFAEIKQIIESENKKKRSIFTLQF
jgi:hypothetical protein